MSYREVQRIVNSKTFVCSSCGAFDFDARLTHSFKGDLCCEYVFVDEAVAIPSTQTFLLEPPEWMFWSAERCERAMEWFRRDGSED